MQPVSALPGLEHLLEVCRSRSHPTKQEPPLPPQALPPMDAQLAAVHARVGFLWVRDEFLLLPARHVHRPDLRGVNEHWRREWAEPFGSLFVFAKDDRLAYCYATVPGVEGHEGQQPVVWLDPYEELYAVPVASGVDAFFDTYARYLDHALKTRDDEDTPPLRAFPWSATRFIARDRELVEQLHAGRFDFLMQANARAREWAAQVASASVRR